MDSDHYFLLGAHDNDVILKEKLNFLNGNFLIFVNGNYDIKLIPIISKIDWQVDIGRIKYFSILIGLPSLSRELIKYS